VNIKNREVIRLANEVALLTGESVTEAIRRALEERKARLISERDGQRRDDLRAFLEQEIWPRMPRRSLGKEISKAEEAALLGYGPNESPDPRF
jgi:antitoxin VapB